MSTSTGKWFSDKMTTTEILTSIIHDVLNEPLRFYEVLNGCTEAVAKSNSPKCRIIACGHTNAEAAFVTALKSGTSAEILLNQDGLRIPSTLRLNQAPRTSKKQKLAIVGMAGRFPNAADHEKFWDLLYAGLDVHREVSIFQPIIRIFSSLRTRSPKIASTSENTTTRMERSAIPAILHTDALLMSPAFSIPGSSICHLERLPKQIQCTDLALLARMRLLRWQDMCRTGRHPRNWNVSVLSMGKPVMIGVRLMRHKTLTPTSLQEVSGPSPL